MERKKPANITSKDDSQRWAWIALGIILIATAAIRFRLLQTPLERDEGEFAYMGQFMLQGVPPYSIAYNMKLPRHLRRVCTHHGGIWPDDMGYSSRVAAGKCRYYRFSIPPGETID